jgi:4'-phosphopantetheinyl transferase
VVAESLGVAPSHVVVDRSCARCGAQHGKPRIHDASLHVSVAHSGDLTAVASTRAGPVGIDIETMTEDINATYRDVGLEVCAGQEHPHITSPGAFLTYWTRKEAVLKGTGDGLRIAPDRVVLTPPDHPPRLVSFPRPVPACYIRDLDLGGTYKGAVAVLSPDAGEIIVRDAAGLLRSVGR